MLHKFMTHIRSDS